MPGGSDSQIFEIKQRLSLIEAQLQQLFTHLQVEPLQRPLRSGGGEGEGDGWWGGSGEDAGGAPRPSDEVIALVEAGKTIDAIKMFREQTGLGLKEAKDAIVSLGKR